MKKSSNQCIDAINGQEFEKQFKNCIDKTECPIKDLNKIVKGKSVCKE